MMLSSAAWVVHDVGLAAAIGGSMFEKTALTPVLKESASTHDRDRISIEAARRYSLIKLGSHLAFAVPWIIGRTMRTGNEVSAEARSLTIAKDVLVGVSLVSGLVGLVLVKGKREKIERGDIDEGQQARARKPPTASGALGFLGTVNLLANVGVMGVTALLAMQASKSLRFAKSSRKLP